MGIKELKLQIEKAQEEGIFKTPLPICSEWHKCDECTGRAEEWAEFLGIDEFNDDLLY